MCGIAGRMARSAMEPAFAAHLCERLSACQRTRGPDGVGSHRDGDLLLVHRRLAILDLTSAGDQPLWNETRTICVIVNGEVYNFASLRSELEGRGHRFRSRSDSEVLVHLYEEGGIAECCRRAEGMFAFALWDARRRELFLVRDRLGIKPLVVAEHAGGVTFGSTTDALLADPDVPRDTRVEALVAALEWGFVPAPWSALRAARRVLPGTWIRIREGRIAEERRWWIDAPAPPTVGEDELRDRVRAAVRSHLVADVPVGTLLSAGIDSGIVTALAARESGADALKVWTASHRGYPEDEFAEASATAAHLGLAVEEIAIGGDGLTEERFDQMVGALDEPLSDTSLIALHELFRPIARDRRVVLTGDGGDEVFGGYSWHAGMPAVPWWAAGSAFRALAPALAGLRGVNGRIGVIGRVAAHVRRHPGSVYIDKLRVGLAPELRALGLEPVEAPILATAVEAWDRFAGRGELEQMLAVDRATLLADHMLAKVDSASMAHSIEARVPLLADRVVDAAKGLAQPLKREGSRGKVVLRRWFQELGPAGASERRKTGFNSPLRAWLAGPAGGWMRERAAAGLGAVGAHSGEPPTARLVFGAAMLDGWLARVRNSSVPGAVR